VAEGKLTVEHVIQPAWLIKSMDQTMDLLQALLGAYPSERVDIKNTGVNNAVYAFEEMTFLELIEPYEPGCSALRLLERAGEGWHMISMDLVEQPNETVEALLDQAKVRVVRRNKTAFIKGAWHLHPRDTEGVLLNLAMRADPNDNSAWAGPPWRQYVHTNTRVVHSIPGTSLVTDDLARSREVYTRLGLSFGAEQDDAGDTVIEARTPRGSWFQIRHPGSDRAPSAAFLAQHGTGLFHMAFDTLDLPAARRAAEKAGLTVSREKRAGGKDVFWTAPHPGVGVPLEFRAR
jgi:catechol 2,3-dioxygenase-like lactoylglutathione lyase family enzyme